MKIEFDLDTSKISEDIEKVGRALLVDMFKKQFYGAPNTPGAIAVADAIREEVQKADFSTMVEERAKQSIDEAIRPIVEKALRGAVKGVITEMKESGELASVIKGSSLRDVIRGIMRELIYAEGQGK